MFFRKKSVYLAVGLFGLVGCAQMTPSPVEQMQQIQTANKQNKIGAKDTAKVSIVKKQSVIRFMCNKEQEVQIRISQSKTKKSSKSINVTFAGTTHTLSPTVSKNGKKYSNIRWVWWEPLNGSAELYDNKKNILAEGCVKQP